MCFFSQQDQLKWAECLCVCVCFRFFFCFKEMEIAQQPVDLIAKALLYNSKQEKRSNTNTDMDQVRGKLNVINLTLIR